MSTTEESVQEQMGPLKVYNRFETKWTERQVNQYWKGDWQDQNYFLQKHEIDVCQARGQFQFAGPQD